MGGHRLCLPPPLPRHPGLDYFNDLAVGLGWKPKSEIAMLWGYFDESGTHDPATGRLTALTIGGCIAPAEAWQSFCAAWGDAMATEPSVKCFHMTDFEYWKARGCS